MTEQDLHDHHDLYFLPKEEGEAVIKNPIPEGVLSRRERELKDKLAKEDVPTLVRRLKERLVDLQSKLQESGNVNSHNNWSSHAHTLALISGDLEDYVGNFTDLEVQDPMYYKYLFEIISDVGY